jgi:hypothetical protein
VKAQDAQLWATPTQRDEKNAWEGELEARQAKGHANPLNAQAVNPHFHQAQATQTDGATGSPPTLVLNPPSLVLNPAFVEVLMNWPQGWTTDSGTERSAYERWVTVSCRAVRLWLSYHCPEG